MTDSFVLIKDYNPAYDFWIRAHLKQKRIMGDREYSWKETQQISMDMSARGVEDKFFRSFFWFWRDHPEHLPDYFDLMHMIFPSIFKDAKTDLVLLGQLDREARGRGQRLLFTVEDAANDFYEFYEKFLTEPLARELEQGADGKKLRRYFELEEHDKVPDLSAHGPEKVENATQEVAQKLLGWLRGLTPEKIIDDIRQTLEQHYDKGLASASPEDSYYYKSEYVAISAHRSEGLDEPVKTFLTPARDYGVVMEGYEGVYYPMYYVIRNSERRAED
jgi:hypothetical protein